MNKQTGIIRQIDGLGRLVIPAGIRHEFDWKISDYMTFDIDQDNKTLIIYKSIKVMFKCNACSGNVHDEYKYCPYCGIELNDILKGKKTTAFMKSSAKFQRNE